MKSVKKILLLEVYMGFFLSHFPKPLPQNHVSIVLALPATAGGRPKHFRAVSSAVQHFQRSDSSSARLKLPESNCCLLVPYKRGFYTNMNRNVNHKGIRFFLIILLLSSIGVVLQKNNDKSNHTKYENKSDVESFM